MGKETAITNTGPVLHLGEIKASNSLKIFSRILCPDSVHNEIIARAKEKEIIALEIKELGYKYKDLAVRIHAEFQIAPAEADAIALCKQEKIRLFLTDDLGARITAKKLGIRPVGSIGIILRAFREKILSHTESIKFLSALHTESSLFVTPYLITKAIESIEKFEKNHK